MFEDSSDRHFEEQKEKDKIIELLKEDKYNLKSKKKELEERFESE